MSKFKVGDKIRLGCDSSVGKKGDIVEITATKNHDTYIEYFCNGNEDLNFWKNSAVYNKSELVKQNEPEFIQTTTNLKPGTYGNLVIGEKSYQNIAMHTHNKIMISDINIHEISVTPMTDSKQVRTVIEQLTKVAEFMEGKGE